MCTKSRNQTRQSFFKQILNSKTQVYENRHMNRQTNQKYEDIETQSVKYEPIRLTKIIKP